MGQKKDRVITLLPVMNDARIAREVGLSRERIRQIRNGYEIPSPAPHLICSVKISEEKFGEIIKLLNSTIPFSVICESFGITQIPLRYKLLKYGIDIRGRKWKHQNIYYKKVSLKKFQPYYEKWKKGKCKVADIARKLNITHRAAKLRIDKLERGNEENNFTSTVINSNISSR